MTDNLKIAEMLCTRFCHDIIGPIGALNNGAEFLREELGSQVSQAADLIESSAKEAVARVQFYRQAYGSGAAESAASLTDMKKISEGYFEAGKITLDWPDAYTDLSGVEINFIQKKVIFNLLVIASSCLIRGGFIKFTISGNKVIIHASGDRAAINENTEKCLKGELPIDQVDPRLIQCHYTAVLLKESNLKVDVSKDDSSVTFTLSL